MKKIIKIFTKEFSNVLFLFGILLVLSFILKLLLKFYCGYCYLSEEEAVKLNIWTHFIIIFLVTLVVSVPLSKTHDPAMETTEKELSRGKIFWIKFTAALIPFLILTSFASYLFLPEKTEEWENILVRFGTIISTTFFFAIAFFSGLFFKRMWAILLSLIVLFIFSTIIFLPGVMGLFCLEAGTQIYNLRGEFGLFTTLFASVLPLGLFLGSAYYLWTKKIKGWKALKPFLLSSLIVFIVSCSIFAAAEINGWMIFNKAVQNAKDAGIELDYEKLIPPPVPDDKNAALIYEKIFGKIDDVRDKYSKEFDKFPVSGIEVWNPYQGQYLNGKPLSLEEKNETAKFILSNPDLQEINALFKEAAKLPECRFNVDYSAYRLSRLYPHLSGTKTALRLLVDRAYALKLEGKDEQVLPELIRGLKVVDSIRNEPDILPYLVYIALNNIVLNAALKIGPTGNEYTDDYKILIEHINNAKNYFPSELSSDYKSIERWLSYDYDVLREELGNSTWLHQSLYVLHPWWLRHCAGAIDYEINNFKMAEKIRNASVFNDEIINNLNNEHHYFSPFYYLNLNPKSGEFKAILNQYKLSFALKIYKGRTGVLPYKLEMLVSEGILPSLSVDPFTGKNFLYFLRGSGFVLVSPGIDREFSRDYAKGDIPSGGLSYTGRDIILYYYPPDALKK